MTWILNTTWSLTSRTHRNTGTRSQGMCASGSTTSFLIKQIRDSSFIDRPVSYEIWATFYSCFVGPAALDTTPVVILDRTKGQRRTVDSYLIKIARHCLPVGYITTKVDTSSRGVVRNPHTPLPGS